MTPRVTSSGRNDNSRDVIIKKQKNEGKIVLLSRSQVLKLTSLKLCVAVDSIMLEAKLNDEHNCHEGPCVFDPRFKQPSIS